VTTAPTAALGTALAVGAGIAVFFAYSSRVDRDIPEVTALVAGGEALRERTNRLLGQVADFDGDRLLAALEPNPFNGPSYRFDDHLDEAVVAEQPPAAPRRSDAGRLAFEFDGDDPVELLPHAGGYAIEDGILGLEWDGSSYLRATRALAVEREAVGSFELRIRHERGRSVLVGWGKIPPDEIGGNESLDDSLGQIRIDTFPDGEFHTYRIDATTVLSKRMNPGDRIRSVVLRPSDVAGDRVEIDYLRFIPKVDRYSDAAVGRSYETLNQELRRVLYAGTPQRLGYSLLVPAQAPRLRFGMGILNDNAPVDFSVGVTDDDGTTEVQRLRVEGSDRWHDAFVDLSPWAGRQVRIDFAAAGGAGNIAFFSNPVLYGAPPRRFNVVIALEDTLRADHLSAYGHERPTSPVKDALALRGVLFERAYSQATKTRPSCPSFMTSLYPSATGVWSHREVLDERFLTLAEVFRSQGFATASFVQNSNGGAAAGLHQGFDHLFDQSSYRGSEALYTEGPIRWLAAHGDRNFLIYLHAKDPHGRYEPKPPFDDWYRAAAPGGTPVRPDRRRLDPAWVTAPTLQGRRLLYDGEIRQNDHWFGHFLAKLAALGLGDDTLVVFISDHGEHLGERGRWSHNPPGFTQVIHVPLLMVLPGVLPEGLRVPDPVQLVDLAPTILDLAGIDRSAMLHQGDSLLGLIRGEAPAYWRSRVAYSDEATRIAKNRDSEVSASLFHGDFHVLMSSRLDATQVFDVVADPDEERPLRDRALRRAVERELRPLMRELKAANLRVWRAFTADSDRVIRYDPAAQEQLRALGYIE
jgi:arylsulfatase A-like enzyme